MSRKPRISDDNRAKIIQMYIAREKVTYIAFVLGISITAVCRIAGEAGLARGKGGPHENHFRNPGGVVDAKQIP